MDSVRGLATFCALAGCQQSFTTLPETKTRSKEGYVDCLVALSRFDPQQHFKTRKDPILLRNSARPHASMISRQKLLAFSY
ncbi:hypothetical protein TNCV_3242911 [Trichonephila clavipes]|nr:hypothetical protein TNCV_3242911 [Trichonephila clavipes]